MQGESCSVCMIESEIMLEGASDVGKLEDVGILTMW
jgi:hypothetical protein